MTIALLFGCSASCLVALMATYQGWISWRLGAVLALAACMAMGAWLLVRFLVRRRNEARAQAWSLPPLDSDTARASDDVEAALCEQIERMRRRLRASRSARRRFDALPWYLVIGAPGAGKSSALEQSRVTMRLDDDDEARAARSGIAFFISRDALFVDCAGAYLVDSAWDDHWKVLIAALARARPSRPLDGVVVAVSVEELRAEEAPRDALAACVRRRLDELMTTLDVPLPVHLMVTKLDLQAGFQESFAEASESEREQVLGFALPRGTSCADDAAMTSQAQRLVQVIERRTVATMGALSTVRARHAAFGFPEQIELLMPRILRLARSALGAAVHLEPVLRGVYLTCATQEVGPCDTRMPALERGSRFDSVPQRPYFLDGLFGKVIARERDGAAMSARWSRRRVRAVRHGGALVGVACVLSSVGMVRAYHHNCGLLHAAEHDLEVALALPREARVGEVLRALEPTRARFALLSAFRTTHLPLSHRFGLYQGDLVTAALRRFYLDALRARFLAALGARLERTLLRFSDDGPEHRPPPSAADYVKLYEQTRAYALLTYPKDRGEPSLDETRADALRHTLLSEVDALSLAPEDRPLVGLHLDTYLALLAVDATAGLSRGPSALAEAQQALRQVSVAKLTIDRIVAQLADTGLDQTVASLLGATSPLLARARVHGAFTRQAWEAHVKPLLDDPRGAAFEAWVLGGESATVSACALHEEYFTRYAEAWRGFLAGIRVRVPSDPRDALILLQDLTRGQPAPIERLVGAVGHHVDLAPAPSAPAQARESGLFDTLRGRLRARAGDPVAPCPRARAEDIVRRALEGFLTFGGGKDAAPGAGQSTAAQVYQEQLVYVRDALQAYLDDPTTAESLLARLSTARTRVRSLIETQEIGWRPRFEALLWPAVDGASMRALAALRSAQSAAFCTAVTLPFARAIKGRYPFDRDGQDTSLADLADVYRPNDGIIWSYYRSTLKRDVPEVGGRFAERERSRRYAPELTRFLEHSAHLTAVLFPPRATEPQVGLALRVRPAVGIARVTLVVDGQSIDFHNGPERWHAVSWPGSSPRRGASMRVLGQGVDEQVVQEGEWGLFRLLERGTVSFDEGARFFTVRFHLRTQHDVVIDVRPLRVDNPFVGPHGFLDAFRASGVTAPRTIVRGEKRRCPVAREAGVP